MTLEHCHDDLELILSAVEIHSPTQYSIRGELRDFSNVPLPMPGESLTSGITPDKTPPAHEPDSEAPVFQTFLEGELYSRLYTRPAAALPASDPLAQRDHISALSTANNGLGTWEPGWKIGSRDEDGRVAVTRDQVTFWVSPTGLRTSTGKSGPEVSAGCGSAKSSGSWCQASILRWETATNVTATTLPIPWFACTGI